jgi:50S ribosomal protein L16 3-hydroxylase
LNSRKHLPELDVRHFMSSHWQRSPMLVRGAFPGFEDPLSPREVLRLAGHEDAAARLVRRHGASSWSVEHGPFATARFKQLPRRDWTVLVQDTNLFSPEAERLLARFDFIPHARIDDVMVSYAARGGGVGPHVDSYDVFLLQGRGRRRWRISRQKDLRLVPGLPLKILARFRPESEWVLEAGDMLYLPPGVAHEGVAETECLTWSIGFRAPTDAELVTGFLDFLRDRLAPPGQYGDAGAAAAAHPGAIPRGLERHVERVLGAVRWTGADAREFAGRFLTEPKPRVYFRAPARPLARAAFIRAAARRGVTLDPGSRIAFSGRMFFLNGETVAVAAPARVLMRRLADDRRLAAPIVAPPAFWDAAHAWYRQGFLVVGGESS